MNHEDPSISSGSSPGAMASQGRNNSRFDPIVVPIGYHFGYGNRVVPVGSGKCPDPTQPWYGERIRITPKTELDFDQWLLTQPEVPKPTSDSYKLWFGGATIVPLKDSFNKTDTSRLAIALPTLADLERSEMFLRAAERKQLFDVHEKYLRQRAPELFRQTNSPGPADIRPRCARCGGNFRRNSICGDCGGRSGMRQKGDDGTRVEGDFALQKWFGGKVSVVQVPNEPVTIAAEEIRRKIATVLVTARHKQDVTRQFQLLLDYETSREPGWTLKDYADRLQMPRETAKAQVRRFRERAAALTELVELTPETRWWAEQVLKRGKDLHPPKVDTYGGTNHPNIHDDLHPPVNG